MTQPNERGTSRPDSAAVVEDHRASTGMSLGSDGQDRSQSGGQGTQMKDQATEMKDKAIDQAGEVKDKATQQAGEMKDKAMEQADRGREKAAEGAETAASRIREQVEGHGGMQETVGLRVADSMEKTAGYLREHRTEEMLDDLEKFAREHPMQALGGAVLAGFVLGRVLR